MSDKSTVLSRGEREEFLSEPHVAALSVASGDEGRAPLTLPIWYQYEPGGELWVMTATASRKAELLTRAGRFSLMVDRLLPTVRYVSVEGPIVSAEPATPEQLEELTRRYLPPEEVAAYVETAAATFGDQTVFRMKPQRWLATDLGA
ncbi:pyridoxamine 5'-phosphate oxidase family protein [Streptomyces tsukubensis]|uniref:pyridoxamine 5'-phosphate oxidase family protein n=1 Tax=Streptomyces tsukubensis TaxID=83656 RepID=UPI00344EB841